MKEVALQENDVTEFGLTNRMAFSSMTWKTGFNSLGELEMTFNTSEVAVCCSSDSLNSRVRAWHFIKTSARFPLRSPLIGKGGDQLDLFLGEGANRAARQSKDPDKISFAQKRHAKHSVIAAKLLGLMQLIVRIGCASRICTVARLSAVRPITLPLPAFSANRVNSSHRAPDCP
jgi:hypothetical protein